MTDRTLEQSLANVRALTGTYAADLNDHYYSDCKVVFDSAERLKELEAENEELLQYKLAVNYLTTKAAEHGVVTLKELLEKLERELADLKAFYDAITGWREWDYPEGFDRRTADLLVDRGRELMEKVKPND